MVNNKYPTDTCIDVFLPFSSFFASTTDIQIVSQAYYTAIEEVDPSRIERSNDEAGNAMKNKSCRVGTNEICFQNVVYTLFPSRVLEIGIYVNDPSNNGEPWMKH